MLTLAYSDVVFQEVPGEVSLALSFSGCPLRCKGCHSTDLMDENNGKPFSPSDLKDMIEKYDGLITCVLFFGGEWKTNDLIHLVDIAHLYGLKTCLYTGRDHIEDRLRSSLDYLKLGPYMKNKGGLNSRKTNQRFYKYEDNNWKNITHIFKEREKKWSNLHKGK